MRITMKPITLAVWCGGGIRTPPPPSRPAIVFEPVFVQFEILGKVIGAPQAPKNFFEAYNMVWIKVHMCLYSKCSDFLGDFKNAKTC